MKQQTDRKIIIKFFITMLVCFVLGGIGGFIFAIMDLEISTVLSLSFNWLQTNGIWFACANLLPVAVGFWFYMRGKRFAGAALSGNDEDAFCKADANYSVSMCISATCIILSLMFFGFSVGNIETADLSNILLAVALLIVSMTANTRLQYVVVNATKALYPEKRGNVLDAKFQKDWFASCDEAEQKHIGYASYKGYMATSYVFPYVFLACIFLDLILEINVITYILITIPWLTMSLSYAIVAAKQPKL